MVDSRTIGRPIIIFVHDIFQNWRTWIIQLEALHNRFRTVAIDLRGFGLSGRHSSLRQYSLDRMAQDIKQLAHILRSECICNQIDTGVEHSKCECKQQSITVCGVGLGGTLAWLLACDSRPEIDRTAIIGSPHPIAHLNSLKQSPLLCLISWFQAFAQLPVLPEMLLLANDLDIVRRRHCRYTNDSQLIKVQELHCLKASLSQPTAMTHALACYRSVSHFQHSILHQPKARVPVILLFGDLDPLCRWSLIQNSLEIAGKTQLFIIPESERYVHLDVSGRISQLISQFADDQNNNVHSLTVK